ncbi:aminoglycoside phosphotransferase family protein [Streptomyces sp. HNM0663]|uniref:Aminoglycoside phosphotransferase family protein n=1 Tax=Streptomyces chengmaiensis TaxID=3040919 RepID=A0ABT6I051_9ACTN|nr:aminoglycoside phosphotransferase family protein [Streptomyces chengmaiensis]MDH2393729.1 aminoglycoside phosphotransferase family protein [Streptomyces chengmaiensis]
MAFEPPQRLVRALAENHGEAAAGEWLARLPKVAQEAVDRWQLDVERVLAPGGRSSLVLLVHCPDGTPAALKVVPPFAASAAERAALEHWDGWGAVRLLSAMGEADGAALLLERLHPEVSLRSLPEAKALLEAAGTVRRLWVEPPPGHRFETVAERTERQAAAMDRHRADAAVGPLVEGALAARAELVADADGGADADAAEAVLLHGDFRQSKVLAGDRAPWLAVGPAPVVGERAYDLAQLARDRADDLIASTSGAAGARRRVNRLADSLDVDRDRLRGWTLFRAVAAAARALAAGRRRDAELALEFASWL